MAFDIVSKVLTKYQADTSDQIRELQKLKGAEAERHKALLEQARQQEEGISKQIEFLGHLNQAIDLGKRAVGLAVDSFKAYADRSRLAAAAGSADLEKLRKASGGLKTEMQLLADAARFNSGAFKLSGEQMAVAERAMRSFTARGYDAAEANKKVLDAVTALKTDGLQELGVFIDKTGLSMEKAADRSEIFRRIMAGLSEETKNVNDSQMTAAERAAATGVAFEDAMDRIKVALGELVIKLAPLVEQVAKLVGMLPGAFDTAGNAIGQGAARNVMFVQDLLDGGNRQRTAAQWDAQQTAGFYNVIPALMNRGASIRALGDRAAAGDITAYGQLAAQSQGRDYTDPLDVLRSTVLAQFQGASDAGFRTGAGAARTRSRSAGPSAAELDAAAQARARAILAGAIDTEARAMFHDRAGGRSDTFSSLGEAADTGPSFTLGTMEGNALSDQLRGIANSRQSAEAEYNARLQGQSESKLAAMFGPIEEFNAYQQAFSMLSGAVGNAMDAWITGSMSAGKAFKAFIAEAVKGLAIQMAMESLKHGAYALGSLAFGNLAGAAAHGKSAALFAAGALAAGIAAKELGGGGSTPTTSRGAGGAPTVGGAGAYNSGTPYQGRQETVIIGDSFGATTPRQMRQNFRKRYEQAYGSAGVMDS